MPSHLILVKNVIRRGPTVLEQYCTGLWADRLAGLFSWEDAGHGKARGWQYSPFRVLAQRLRHMVTEELGEKARLRFEDAVEIKARRKLWIIPQYDLDKLSVLRKASKHNASRTAEELQALSPLARTNWMMPQLDAEYHAPLARLERMWEGEEVLTNRDELMRDEILAKLRNHYGLAILSEGSIASSKSGLVRDPEKFGISLKLRLAKIFWDALNQVRGNH